ncbi:MAG TPA: response regulator [Candidatus Moranbacteria bacterium]|nr:response regulator [Candidatus Moranbacteria bacterium]HAT74872.1 response regulator [Candidatus Moranbacteria bacterium]
MPTILIVEDEPMISDIYQKKFRDQGFEVLSATAGDQVLEMVRKQKKVDVILLDLLIPKMDGFEVIRNLRNGRYDPKIKIVVSSNLNQLKDMDKAFALGADSFFIKAHFTPSQVVREVNKIIGNIVI